MSCFRMSWSFSAPPGLDRRASAPQVLARPQPRASTRTALTWGVWFVQCSPRLREGNSVRNAISLIEASGIMPM